mmetsp:Transcript_23553/g.69737  ORF Transcript_23553/g.69737 Transcript_23553/m.69737 type:complete len:114 (+) Transcript_23553:923-1264(+)
MIASALHGGAGCADEPPPLFCAVVGRDWGRARILLRPFMDAEDAPSLVPFVDEDEEDVAATESEEDAEDAPLGLGSESEIGRRDERAENDGEQRDSSSVEEISAQASYVDPYG